MNIVNSAVRVLILTFVLVGGAVTFAGPQAKLGQTEPASTLEPAASLSAPNPDASAAERNQDESAKPDV